MIDVWEFEFNQIHGSQQPDYCDTATVQHAFDWNLSNLAALEQRGFTGVFFSEHHFVSQLSPNPNLLIAALSQRTENLRIGVMGNVLPFHQPFRLAEDLAMLDYLTHGRLEIGYANGAGPMEFQMIGIDPEEVRPISAEVMEVVDKALEKEVIDHRGQYYSYEDLYIMPRPRQERRRRKWMTIMSPASATLAAERGYKICSGFQSAESMAVAFDAYREAAARVGRPARSEDLGVRRQVLIWDNDADAAALGAEARENQVRRVKNTYLPLFERLRSKGVAGLSAGVVETGVIDAAAPASATGDKAEMFIKATFEGSGEFIVGSPKAVAEQIIEQCRVTGGTSFLAYHYDSLEEDQLEHHYDLWNRVVPILKKADVVQNAV